MTTPRLVRPQHTLVPVVRCLTCDRRTVACVCGSSHATVHAPVCPSCTAMAQVGLLLEPSQRRVAPRTLC